MPSVWWQCEGFRKIALQETPDAPEVAAWFFAERLARRLGGAVTAVQHAQSQGRLFIFDVQVRVPTPWRDAARIIHQSLYLMKEQTQ